MRLKRVCMAALALSAICSAGARAWAAPLATYWKLNETTTVNPAAEETGNIADGTYGAAVTLNVASAFAGLGTAAQFSGAATSEVNVGGGTFLTATSNFSTSAWVNFDNFSGKHTYLGNNRWGVRNTTTAQPHITTFGVKDYEGNAGAFTAGQWHHVVTVIDSSFDAQFYVDGLPAGSETHTAGSNSNTGAFAIGAAGVSGSERMQGRVDDVGVFTTALTATQARAIYSLAADSHLGYDLGEVNQMLTAFDNGDASVVIDGRIWERVSGLSSAPGQVMDLTGGHHQINLAGGVGFAAVPEPASIAVWSLLGLVGMGYVWSRRRMR